MDIWNYILRMGYNKIEVKIIKLLFECEEPMTPNEIREALNYNGALNIDKLFDKRWIIPHNARMINGRLTFIYKTNDLYTILENIERELDEDYLQQKHFVEEARRCIKDHNMSVQNNRNRDPKHRVGNPRTEDRKRKKPNRKKLPKLTKK